MNKPLLRMALVAASVCLASSAFAQRGGGDGGSGGGSGGDPSILQLRNSDYQQRVLGAEFQRRQRLGLCSGAVCRPQKTRNARDPNEGPVPCLPGMPCRDVEQRRDIQTSESCNSGTIRYTMVQGIRRYGCDGRPRRRS